MRTLPPAAVQREKLSIAFVGDALAAPVAVLTSLKYELATRVHKACVPTHAKVVSIGPLTNQFKQVALRVLDLFPLGRRAGKAWRGTQGERPTACSELTSRTPPDRGAKLTARFESLLICDRHLLCCA